MIYPALCVLVTIMFAVEGRRDEEPVCSKFHFEEKVLEKLVRLEHQMELHQNRLEAWDDKMVKQITKAMKAETDWTNKLENQINDLNKAETIRSDKMNGLEDSIQQELQDHKDKLAKTLTDFQNQVVRLSQDLLDKQKEINKTMQSSLNSQEQAVNAFKAELVIPTVVFKAKTAADTSPTSGSIIRYRETVTNVGGGYDTQTGYFTVPKDGTYIFTVQICIYKVKWLSIHLMAADVVIDAVTYYEDSADSTCTSGTGVVVLKTGDKVWVKCSSASSGTVFYQDSYRWNSFSGVLIHTNTD